jgi:hypothetical protein
MQRGSWAWSSYTLLNFQYVSFPTQILVTLHLIGWFVERRFSWSELNVGLCVLYIGHLIRCYSWKYRLCVSSKCHLCVLRHSSVFFGVLRCSSATSRIILQPPGSKLTIMSCHAPTPEKFLSCSRPCSRRSEFTEMGFEGVTASNKYPTWI